MRENPLKQLAKFGQSIWLDYIRRDLITSGELQSLIENDGLMGITSNPAIFEKAITESHFYNKDIMKMTREGKDPKTIYEALSQQDVQMAADVFRQVYDETEGKDGYVSLEVNPHLAHNTSGTIEEARRLWDALDRPNVFIKIPATAEGLPAIQQLISEGININITLLFGLPRYREVVNAYMTGLEIRAAHGNPINHVASVASFFLSRIDTLLDPILEDIVAKGGRQSRFATEAVGEVAIASAKEAYQIYKEFFSSIRFKRLADKGAQVQRLLWASTSTKNPVYSDVKYIEPLIGKDTINTVPLETLDAYGDHGEPTNSLELEIDKSDWIMHEVKELGININKITQYLEDEGIEKFVTPFDDLMEALEKKSEVYLCGK